MSHILSVIRRSPRLTRFMPDLFLFVTSSCLGLLLLFGVGLEAKIKKVNEINTGYKTPDAVSFMLYDDAALTSADIRAVLSPGNRLYKEASGMAQEMTLYSYNGDTCFDLVSGRQFTEDDLSTSVDLQQIGADLPSEGIETIGILGLAYPSRLDLTRIVLPSKEMRDVLPRGRWVLDGPKHPARDFERLTKLLADARAEAVPTEYTGTYRMYNQSYAISIITGLVLVLYVLGLAMIIQYWLDAHACKITILILMGVGNAQILEKTGLYFTALFTGGGGLGMAIGFAYAGSIYAYISVGHILAYCGLVAIVQIIAIGMLYRNLKHWNLGMTL